MQLVELFVKDGLQNSRGVPRNIISTTRLYALALLDAEAADTIFVAKNKSPLLVGVGDV
ncbi:Glutamine--fructose-6-phosphate aminotransferase [isomerizing] OS=Lysinibacillus sphaericus OT4b.31 OX=1285586 GN=glmS PE=3 SV=1 [Lysinibacillus sphaericus]